MKQEDFNPLNWTRHQVRTCLKTDGLRKYCSTTELINVYGLTNHIALMYRAIVPANRPMAIDGDDSHQADAGPFVAAEHHPDVAPSINTSADEGKREAETDGAAAPVKREKW